MKQNFTQFLPGTRGLCAALAIAVLAAISSPGTATANTTAGTTIMNVVQVNYNDATGNNPLSANASATVTVNLVKAALSTYGAPTGASGTNALACLTAFEAPSGSTINALYALAATANGTDSYNLSIATGAQTNVNNVSVNFSTLNYQGALDGLTPVNPDPATRVLASAIPIGFTGTNVLQFPGGALTGFAVNNIVIVPTALGNQAFLVTAVSVGNAAAYSNGNNTAYTGTGTMTQAEVKGTLTLGAYANQTISLNSTNDTTFGGGNTAPTFSTTGAPTLGVPVSQMILVKVSVSARTTSITDGSVAYTLTTTNSSGLLPSTISCTAGNFQAPQLSIEKQVRNVTTSGTFAGTAAGNPGDILEYQITVSNANGQGAQVVVTDAVPTYTQLVTFGTSYGAGTPAGTLADFFARVSDTAGNYVDITRSASDSEPQPGGQTAHLAFGNSTNALVNPVPAGTTMTFYLGDLSTSTAGGVVPACSTTGNNTTSLCASAGGTWQTSYTVKYQVKIL